MVLEAFAMTLRNLLRVPLGASIRKNYPSTSPSNSSGLFEDNEYVQAIVDITTDDICIGDAPLSIDYASDTDDDTIEKFQQIRDEFNSIIKWACKDLLKLGYSLYKASVNKKNHLVLLPCNSPVEFYLSKDKEVIVFDASDGSTKKKSLTDLVVFINFEKSSLELVEDKEFSKFAYKINPCPMQFKNAAGTVDKLTSAENSIAKARALLGRIPRWVNVDVGASSGDTQKNVVDEISSAINANSDGLAGSAIFTEFDDNIPVIPNRRGLGKPELQHDAVDVNIREIKDLDYFLSKLSLVSRFPASYIDFSKNLDSTAVSLIRGDVRYAKLCTTVRSKLEVTLNDYIQDSKFAKYKPVFSLTKLPNSEDSDVMASLDEYTDTSKNVEEFVIGSGDVLDKNGQLFRLQLLQDLLSASTNSPSLQKWFEDYRRYISKEEQQPGDEESGPSSDIDINVGGPDVETFDEGLDTEDFEEPEISEETEISSPSEGEFVAPQTEA